MLGDYNKAGVIEQVVKDTWIQYPKLDKALADTLLDRASKLRQLDIPTKEFY